MIELAFVALLSLASGASDGAVRGTILSDRGEPVAGVRIEVPAARVIAWSDSTGGYAIEGLEPGTYDIRFERFAYDPLALTVTVPVGAGIELDVRLRTRFVLLPPISVFASAGGGDAPAVGASPFRSNGLPEVGSREIAAEAIWSDPLVPRPDALATLVAIPGIDMAEESPTQISVRGGPADGNLVLLDGVPVYASTHTSGVLGAILPDAVSRIDVHGGVLPARFGGRLSSVVDVRTVAPGAAGFQVRGGAGVPDVRAMVDAPLPGGAGGVLLGARRTAQDLIDGGPFSRIESSGFEDVLARVALEAGGGAVEVLFFGADNWLSSAAGGLHAAAPDDGSAAGNPPAARDDHNGVRWRGGTAAVTWTRPLDSRSETQLRAWRSGARSDVEWGSTPERHRLRSSLEHVGAAGELAWRDASSTGRAGLAVEWISTTYRTESSTPASDPRSPVASRGFEGHPAIVSTYLEQRWIPRDRWMLTTGLRAVHVETHGLAIEPRVSAHFRPGAGLTLSGGYGRVHQYVQSLANEESLLNAAYAVEPLVAAGTSGTPVSRSDQLAFALEARLSERASVTLDAYTRWLDDLLLVAPATDEPYATTAFARGQGRSEGLGAALTYRGERLRAEAIAELSRVRRTAGGVTYRPRLERRRSLVVAAAWRVLPSTSLRTAFHAAAGPPTSRLASGFEWEVFDQLSGEVEFRGTPRRAPGPLNAERLPAYLRWDLGVRREWRYSGPGPEGAITTYLDVINVLGRENALGYQIAPGGSDLEVLTLLPTSVLFGIEWRF